MRTRWFGVAGAVQMLRGDMRILGAKFQTRPQAVHALEHVRSRFGNETLSLAPLATDAGTATLLAGTFEDVSRDEARNLLVDHGGEIVSDVDERLAR